MAAVVASLAGILAGCSLPVQHASGTGGRGFVTADPAEERELRGRGTDPQSPGVWAQTRQAACYGIVETFAEALSIKSGALQVVQAPAEPGQAPEPARKILKHGPLAEGSVRSDHCGDVTLHVRFDLAQVTEHEITPYSEVYNGVHPRDFNFGKGLPAPYTCFVDPRAKQLPPWRGVGSDDSDDEEDVVRHYRGRKGQRVLGCRSIPQHVWIMLGTLCFIVRAFGASTIFEALEGLPGSWHLKFV